MSQMRDNPEHQHLLSIYIIVLQLFMISTTQKTMSKFTQQAPNFY
jgi:hypothetical protein